MIIYSLLVMEMVAIFRMMNIVDIEKVIGGEMI